ncbi:hypothetical protein E2562_034122 [Oryza meyeriana var. granulata]|uniref:Transposase MuDR plant domain-containing protein n=1 Tax=Oryza meyeriana var. granulata TaxID=110450 RepID=A0A6G1E8J5_9ORYZ|nr:hypothetical protein E2562_034122 [Oryza meyeriana var. granulata]
MPDVFDMEEYVGVNDEDLYIHVPPIPPPDGQPCEPAEASNPAEGYVEVEISDADSEEIKKLSFPHECPTTKLMEGKMATQGWIADRLGDWIKKNPQKGAKDAKEKLEEKYEIKLKYSKAWAGMKLALD